MFPNLIISSSPYSVPHLKDLVLVRAVEWYDLGLQLGVENTELKVIQQNNPGDLRPCRREMFEAWLRITPNPSYQWLVEALLAVGETNEADRLCKKYGKIWLYWKLKCLDIRLSSILFRD